MKIVSFKEFNNLNESKSSYIKKDFSFSTWLVESSDPQMRATIAAISNTDALKKAELIMELVKQKLFTHFPMFRPFMVAMPPIPSFGAGSKGPDGIGTMSTSGSAIFYDPRFVILTYERGKTDFFKGDASKIPSATKAIKEGLRHPVDYALFVIVHEILHNSLKHFLRGPVPSELISEYEMHRLWNIATDFEINHILKEDANSKLVAMFPGGVDADDPNWGVPEGEREFFKTASAEKIFGRLLRNLEAKRQEEKGETGEEEEEEEDTESGEDQEGNEEGNEEGDQESDEEGEDEGEGGEQEGEGDEEGDQDGEGEGDQDGEDGDGDSGGEGGEGGKLKAGDIIYDKSSGTYGIVSSTANGEVEYDEISEVEAKKRLGI